MKESDGLLYIVAGAALGAIVVYIALTQLNKSTVMDITRDANGRVITIVEKKL